MPRHFLPIAEPAGVGAPLMRSIFEDLAASAEMRTDAVIADQLVTSVRAAVKSRAALLSNALEEAAVQTTSGDA